jgi:WD40 repeat protein
MEQWLKLIFEYAVPILNTLLSVRNSSPLSGIHIELDEKRRQAQLMLEYLGNDSEQKAEQKQQGFYQQLAQFGFDNRSEIAEFIQSVNLAIQQNSVEYQQWRFAQEKALQQQLAGYNRETQLKVAQEQRETTLKLAEVEKILENWPLRLLPSQILKSYTGTGSVPLRIILSPPDSNTLVKNLTKQFESLISLIPDIETRLSQGLREFLNRHYPFHHSLQPTEFLGGVWESSQFHSEASIKALFGLLKSEPTLVLESEVDQTFINFRMAYWGLAQSSYCYETIVKLPYRQILVESVKSRALLWKTTQEKLLKLGKTEAEIEKLAGDNALNLKVLEEEEILKAAGIDVSQLSLSYHFNTKDFEELTELLIRCHCLVAGWMADIHYLIQDDIHPKLPNLLPDLMVNASEPQWVQQVIQTAITSYQDVVQSLVNERPYWQPELLVKIAKSLVYLPDKSWAKQQIQDSLESWLDLHHLSSQTGTNVWQTIKPALGPQDRQYLETLKECLGVLGDENEVEQINDLLREIPQLNYQPTNNNFKLAHTISDVSERPIGIVLSPDATLVAGSLDKNSIGVWNVATSQLQFKLNDHAGQVLRLSMSPDGSYLVSSDKTEHRSKIYIWDLHTGKLLRTLFGHKKSIHALTVSPDGQTLASGSHKIKIWNVQTGEPVRTLFGHKEWVYALAMTPDGNTIISGSADKTLKIWQPKTEQLLQTLKGHLGSIYSVAISPDGTTLVSGSADQTVKIWNLQTGTLLRTLEGHSGSVYSVAISANGETLASASADKTVKIWRLQTGKECQTLAIHSDAVYSVAMSGMNIGTQKNLSPTLVTSSADKTIQIWHSSGLNY